jgi:hypothetical protein
MSNEETETTETEPTMTAEQIQQMLNESMAQLYTFYAQRAASGVKAEKVKAKAMVELAKALGPEQYLELRKMELEHERHQFDTIWGDLSKAVQYLGSEVIPQALDHAARGTAAQEMKAKAYADAVEKLQELAEKHKVRVSPYGFEVEPLAAK